MGNRICFEHGTTFDHPETCPQCPAEENIMSKMNCRICGGVADIMSGETAHTDECPFRVDLIAAQQAGDDIFEMTTGPEFMSVKVSDMVKMRDALNEAIGKFDGALELVKPGEETEVSGNFGFYLDGYTLASTDKIGEVRLTAMDGRTRVVTSKSLTAWIDRRLQPEPSED